MCAPPPLHPAPQVWGPQSPWLGKLHFWIFTYPGLASGCNVKFKMISLDIHKIRNTKENMKLYINVKCHDYLYPLAFLPLPCQNVFLYSFYSLYSHYTLYFLYSLFILTLPDTFWYFLTLPDTSWHILIHPDTSWHMISENIVQTLLVYTLLHGIMGRRFPDGRLLRYRKWVPLQLGDVIVVTNSPPIGLTSHEISAHHHKFTRGAWHWVVVSLFVVRN